MDTNVPVSLDMITQAAPADLTGVSDLDDFYVPFPPKTRVWTPRALAQESVDQRTSACWGSGGRNGCVGGATAIPA